MSQTVHTWAGLPDPSDPAAPSGRTCDVAVNAARLLHMIQGHLAPRAERAEWSRWLTRSAVEAAARAERSYEDEQPLESMRTIAIHMERWVRASFAWPLVWIKELLSENTKREIWGAVLPIGAILIIRRARGRAAFVTAYFKSEDLNAPLSSRWRNRVRALVQKHAEWNPSARSFIVQPTSPVRFVTPERWGFATGYAYSPWRAPEFSWPEAEAAVRSAEPFPLKPRRRPRPGGPGHER